MQLNFGCQSTKNKGYRDFSGKIFIGLLNFLKCLQTYPEFVFSSAEMKFSNEICDLAWWVQRNFRCGIWKNFDENY